MSFEGDAALSFRPYLDAACVFVLLLWLIRDMLLGFIPASRSSKSAVHPGEFVSLGKEIYFIRAQISG